MVTPAQAAPGTMTGTGPAEPVPVAVLARTSTLLLQDPVASVRRQLRSCEQWLPPGWFIAAVYSDVESGGTDLDKRSQGDGWKVLTAAGLPRDGGMADLLAEAASPAPKFAAVVCEDIERSARDTFNALRLEKELSGHGIPLFATDEPADIAGINATTVLVRRVKQGVAEWYRIQLKEKVWKGLVEHSVDGWNIGTPPHGYRAERHPHPNPLKASQGRTKTRLAINPATAPAIRAIYTWRTQDKVGVPTICARLNADPGTYPPPPGAAGWNITTVHVILANPKYTGHMVYGRRRNRNGRHIPQPPDQWLWSPQPTHPPIIDQATWHAAQKAGAEHGTSRDTDDTTPVPATGRIYPYRSRIRCRDCKRRMAGNAKGPRRQFIYYRCPHDPASPRDHATAPNHPVSVQAPQTRLDQITGRFFRDHVFTPGRAQRLAAQLPVTDAAAAAARTTDTAALKARIKKLDTAQAAQIKALEQIPDSPAAAAIRARIMDRFTELHDQRTTAETQLTALTTTQPVPADPAILDEIPYAGDLLPTLPPQLKARLFAAFDLHILWNKPGNQATIHIEITDTTLHALPAILNPDQDGYHDTAAPEAADTAGSPAAVGPLTQLPIGR
jgi:site-specific DNA recombinase